MMKQLTRYQLKPSALHFKVLYDLIVDDWIATTGQYWKILTGQLNMEQKMTDESNLKRRNLFEEASILSKVFYT